MVSCDKGIKRAILHAAQLWKEGGKKEKGRTRNILTRGKLAESSDKTKRGELVCPNIRPKNDGPNIRHDFQFLAYSVEYASLFRQKMRNRFRILTLKLPLPERSEAKETFLVPTLSPKSDPWG